MKWIFFFLFHLSLLASSDYDYIFVGTSPFSLFEALYRAQMGSKVLILEADSRCGGAWRSIAVCGVEHADLGCHQIGSDLNLKAFLEEYVGCKMVSLDNPQVPYEEKKGANGYYFSKGCHELVEHLLQMVHNAGIELYTEMKVENVIIDPIHKTVSAQTKDRQFTGKKLVATPMSCLTQKSNKSRYYHLYLLIQDPTGPKFSYKSGLTDGVSRIMNLTHFVDIASTGRQLIVIQTHNEENLCNGQKYLEALKTAKLIDPSAYTLQSETYIYETGSFHQNLIQQMGAQDVVEILQTGHIQTLSNHIKKWKDVIAPYHP